MTISEKNRKDYNINITGASVKVKNHEHVIHASARHEMVHGRRYEQISLANPSFLMINVNAVGMGGVSVPVVSQFFKLQDVVRAMETFVKPRRQSYMLDVPEFEEELSLSVSSYLSGGYEVQDVLGLKLSRTLYSSTRVGDYLYTSQAENHEDYMLLGDEMAFIFEKTNQDYGQLLERLGFTQVRRLKSTAAPADAIDRKDITKYLEEGLTYWLEDYFAEDYLLKAMEIFEFIDVAINKITAELVESSDEVTQEFKKDRQENLAALEELLVKLGRTVEDQANSLDFPAFTLHKPFDESSSTSNKLFKTAEKLFFEKAATIDDTSRVFKKVLYDTAVLSDEISIELIHP